MAAAAGAGDFDSSAPRNFYLLAELDREDHHGKWDASFGLVDAKDIELTEFNALIIGRQGSTSEHRSMEMRVVCGKEYPDTPPMVRFLSKVNLTFVGPDGNVDLRKVKSMGGWRRGMTIRDMLEGFQSEILSSRNNRQKQPAEGERY
mmetsp:Transcript_36669/g.96031  ORF Transcript_36669/g.96031 Transcript_36669/m.96031 type:complete len:147 (+) Transcript_36669:46-486(+)